MEPAMNSLRDTYSDATVPNNSVKEKKWDKLLQEG